MDALIIGGTGPTGPFIIDGLVERGYNPVILHRGTHELDFLEKYEHLHADPHFAEPVVDVLGNRTFDLVIASYGRLRVLIDVLAGHTGRLVTVGGTVYSPQPWSVPADESAARDTSHKLVARLQETEEAVMARHTDGTYNVTHLRYPALFGPRQLAPREWSIVRRILDGRRTIPVMDGGLTLEAKAYVENAANALLTVVDHPDKASGQIYHIADTVTPTDAQRAQAIAAAMGAEVEIVDYPPAAGRPAYFWGNGRNLEAMGRPGPPPTHHKLVDSTKIRAELGYTDLVPYGEAVRRTVEYLLANPLERGGEIEAKLGDSFDYAGEDRFQQELADFVDRCATLPFTDVVSRHPYDHPKAPVTKPAEA